MRIAPRVRQYAPFSVERYFQAGKKYPPLRYNRAEVLFGTPVYQTLPAPDAIERRDGVLQAA